MGEDDLVRERPDGRWTVRHLVAEIDPDIFSLSKYDRKLAGLEQEQPGLGELYDQLLAVCCHHDLEGLVEAVNPDEYSPEVDRLLRRLGEVHSSEGLAWLVRSVFIEMFNKSKPEDVAFFAPLAHDMWQVWQEWRRTHAAPDT